MTLVFEPTVYRAAAGVAISLFLLMAVIQIGVAAGTFPVNILWGGRYDHLTSGLACASVVAAMILCGFAFIIWK